MKIEAIIYDLDGTMIDTEEKVWCASNKELLGRRGIPYDRAMKHLLVGKSTREGMRVLQETYGITGDLAALTAERKEIILGLLDQARYVEGFRAFFASHKGLPAAIGTSMHREFFSRIDAFLDLSGLVDHVTCIEDVGGVGKPDPAIFLHAAGALGVDPKYCLVIEDAQGGVDAARAAGMHTIGLTRVFPDVRADFVVDSYAEIDLAKRGFVIRH